MKVERSAPFLALLAALTLALTACQAPLTFPAPDAHWKTAAGQLQYRGANGRSVIGDVVVSRSPRGDFQLAFSSGPGFPLLRLWESGGTARAEGALARGSWQGRVKAAPAPLKSWLALPETFAKTPPVGSLDLTIAGDHFAFHLSR